MGTYNKGILGAFSGKVGPVVGANWRGKEVMRSLPRKSKKQPTEIQMLQREKFAMVTQFITPISPVLRRYFGKDNGERTRRNAAMSYLIKEAVDYVNPNFVWQYNKVLISRGDLLGINAATVIAGIGTSIDLTWTDNSGQGEAMEDDKLVVVVYEPTSKTSVYSLDLGMRSEEAANMVLPEYLSGLTVQVWATFASVNDKLYATSQYLGQVVLP